ncbi:MAG: hypothetical protein HGA35_03550 [Erysipelotrichaceae bacterium]|nr:hypothetical protein [Erysipelotrichaceae bacterium]
MQLSEEDKKAILQLSLISGINEQKIQEMFESFLILFTLDYSSRKSIRIPLVGNFLIKYRGEEITDEGREATVDAFYSPSDEVKRIIGQLVDIEETFDYTKLDTFKLLKRNINNDFKLNMEKETFA